MTLDSHSHPHSHRAVLMLVLVTLLWGLSFPLVKTWQEAGATCPDGKLVSSLSILAIRMFLAVILLAVWKPSLVHRPTRQEHRFGAVLGVLMFLSLGLQFWGMAWRTSPALSAFITSLGSAWVPILAWVCFQIVVRGITVLGLIIGVIGVGILTLQPSNNWTVGEGEWLTLASTIPFALQIVVLDHVGQKVRSEHLTVSLFLSTAVLSLGTTLILTANGAGVSAWLTWMQEMLSTWEIALTVIGLVILPTILAFLWMNQYQPHVSPGQAALVYLLEPIFTTLISIPWGYDELTVRLVIGGALVILGNLIVESR